MDRNSAIFLVILMTAMVLCLTSGKVANKRDTPLISSMGGDSETGGLGVTVSEDPLIVNTKYGSVRGTYSDGVRVFHGVPYAQPPVGDLRWQRPVEPVPWHPEVLDTTTRRPGCIQECSLAWYCADKTSEDCLFLELYVPERVSSLVPVMLYIHGGSFKEVSTTIPIFNATALVKRSGLIVVLVEYRLGALGFLVTGQGTSQAEGNYGLYDQRLAMSFVRENIGAFGGDHEKVTVVGQSAGAQSLLVHLFSEESSQYFRSAIVESMPFALPYRTLEAASQLGRTLADTLNCVDNNKNIDMKCLRSKSTEQILNAQITSTMQSLNPFDKIQYFSPVVDSHIVESQQPLDSLKNYSESNKQSKPLIFGYTKDEGHLFVNDLFPDPVPSLTFKFLIGAFVGQLPEKMYQLYPVINESDARIQLSDILTDFMFRCPLIYTIRLLAGAGHNQGPWLYTWDRPLRIELPKEMEHCENTSCHSVEIPFIFQTFNTLSNVTNKIDIELSNHIIDYYTNFIIYGNPNGDKNNNENTSKVSEERDLSSTLTDWQSAFSDSQAKELSRLFITPDGKIELVKNVEDKFCDFWNEVGYSILSKK